MRHIIYLPIIYLSTFLSCCSLFIPQAYALEQQTVSIISQRLQFSLDNNTFANFTFHNRFLEGFTDVERSILEARIGRNYGPSQISLAYNIHLHRKFQEGQEHRLWQQYRYRFSLPNSNLDFSVRVEERYFDRSSKAAARSRFRVLWSKPISEKNMLTLGNELVINLTTLSPNTQQGFSQNRFIAGLRHNLGSGRQIDFNYQLRYVHKAQANIILNQIQLMYRQSF